jgi:hypothetical protein
VFASLHEVFSEAEYTALLSAASPLEVPPF